MPAVRRSKRHLALQASKKVASHEESEGESDAKQSSDKENEAPPATASTFAPEDADAETETESERASPLKKGKRSSQSEERKEESLPAASRRQSAKDDAEPEAGTGTGAEWGSDWDMGCCEKVSGDDRPCVECTEKGCGTFWHFCCLETSWHFPLAEIERVQLTDEEFVCPTCDSKRKKEKQKQKKKKRKKSTRKTGGKKGKKARRGRSRHAMEEDGETESEADAQLVDDDDDDDDHYVEPPPVTSLLANLRHGVNDMKITSASNGQSEAMSVDGDGDRDAEDIAVENAEEGSGVSQEGDVEMKEAALPDAVSASASVAASRPRRAVALTTNVYATLDAMADEEEEADAESEDADDDSDDEGFGVGGLLDGLEMTEEEQKLIAAKLKAHQEDFQASMKRQRQLRLAEIKNQCKFTVDVDITDEEAAFMLDFCGKHQFDVLDKLEDEGMFFVESMREMLVEKKRQAELNALRKHKRSGKRGAHDSESEWECDSSDMDDWDTDSSFSAASEDDDVGAAALVPDDEDADYLARQEARRAARRARKVNAKKGYKLNGQVRCGRLLLDDAMKNKDTFEGWSEARIKAYEQRESNPNCYYYRFLDPGFEQGHGTFTDGEHKLFMQRLKEMGANDRWGEFSRAVPHRVGYQCSNYYRDLLKKGWISDPNYHIDSSGKLHFRRGAGRSKEKGLAWRQKCFAFTVRKDPSGVWKDLPAKHEKCPPKHKLFQYRGKGAKEVPLAEPPKKKGKGKGKDDEEENEEQGEGEKAEGEAEAEADADVKEGKGKKQKKGKGKKDDKKDKNTKKEKKEKKKKKSSKKDKAEKKAEKEKKKAEKKAKKEAKKKTKNKEEAEKSGKEEASSDSGADSKSGEGSPSDEAKVKDAIPTASESLADTAEATEGDPVIADPVVDADAGDEDAEAEAANTKPEAANTKPAAKRKRTKKEKKKRKHRKRKKPSSGDDDLSPPTKRRRRRRGGKGSKGGSDADDDEFTASVEVQSKREAASENNPLPEMVDFITGDIVERPAISPFGHVLGYETWCKLLRRAQSKNTCPFTRQSMTRRSLVCLTKENFAEYKDRIINFSEQDRMNV